MSPAGGALLKELKKVDDKALLVEVQLLESRAYHKIGNITKARWGWEGDGEGEGGRSMDDYVTR